MRKVVLPDELKFAAGALAMGMISRSIGRAAQRAADRLAEPENDTQAANAGYFRGQAAAGRWMTPGFFALAVVLFLVGMVRLVVLVV